MAGNAWEGQKTSVVLTQAEAIFQNGPFGGRRAVVGIKATAASAAPSRCPIKWSRTRAGVENRKRCFRFITHGGMIAEPGL